MWLFDFLKRFKEGGPTGDLPSPRNFIDRDDVVYDRAAKRLIIENIEPEVVIDTVQNTNSMERSVDVGHIAIRSTAAKYMADIHVGDVIVWEKDSTGAIHQIVEVSVDADGWYCRTQGWNTVRKDVVKIRRSEIKDVVLMVIFSYGKGFYSPKPGD